VIDVDIVMQLLLLPVVGCGFLWFTAWAERRLGPQEALIVDRHATQERAADAARERF
jgi:hypothetical protein